MMTTNLNTNKIDLSKMTTAQKLDLYKTLQQKIDHDKNNQLLSWFSDSENYPKHISFLKDGNKFKQRAFLAGNRVGKSMTGAYETACHLTGLYPDWWEGRRFTKETSGWVVGKTGIVVRETTQVALLGPLGSWGSGMIPKDKIVKIVKTAGSAVDYIQVKHTSGGLSTVHFKSNDAGRQSFEGTSKDFIWLDEECDQEIYFECLVRTMTTDGIIYTTFTPLKGLTPLIMSLLKDGNLESPADGVSVTTCGWDDAPHLDEKTKLQMLSDLPPWQRLSRSRGIPSLGSGVIYPIDPSEYTISPIEIPPNWLKIAALDVGWKRTAALFISINPNDGVMYITSEHYRGDAEPVIHAEAIKSRGAYPIAIDPAAHGRSQIDGENLFKMYEDMGLELYNANKAVESGLATTWSHLSFGKIKIFNNCTNLLSELKTYRRDDKGHIVKSNDHLCDCLRYAVMTKDIAKVYKPKIAAVSYGYNRYTKTGL